jgi:hypothetical protein
MMMIEFFVVFSLSLLLGWYFIEKFDICEIGESADEKAPPTPQITKSSSHSSG